MHWGIKELPLVLFAFLFGGSRWPIFHPIFTRLHDLFNYLFTRLFLPYPLNRESKTNRQIQPWWLEVALCFGGLNPAWGRLYGKNSD